MICGKKIETNTNAAEVHKKIDEIALSRRSHFFARHA